MGNQISVTLEYIRIVLWGLSNLHNSWRPLGWIRMVENPKGLVVFLHGVNQKQRIFSMYAYDLLSEIPSEVDVYAPFLKHHHNGPVEIHASEALVMTREWHEKYPNLPILLVGFSNGGRIAAHVESQLCLADVRVLTIGSPLNGTYVLDWIPQLLLNWRIGDTLRREMAKEPLIFNKKRYTHIAAAYDWMVWPPERAALSGNPVQVIEAHGHISLMQCEQTRHAIRSHSAALLNP